MNRKRYIEGIHNANRQMMRLFLIVIVFTLLVLLQAHDVMAHPGWGIVLDKRGNIYFTDVGRNIVWRIDRAGAVKPFITGKHSHQLAIDGNGTIYGEHVEYDSRNNRWLSHRWKATPDGNVTVIPEREVTPGLDLVDADGNVYLFHSDAHKREAWVWKVSPRGDTALFAGEQWGDVDGKGRTARFRNFGGVTWGPESCLYASSGGMLRKIRRDGTVTTLLGANKGFGDPDEPGASSILGVATDGNGNVYAAHDGHKKLYKVDARGRVTTALDSGPLWMPTGVAFAGNDVYVLEDRAGVNALVSLAKLGGPRVRKISPDGTVTIMGTAK